MADLKISQLNSATTPLAGTEVLPIVQSGTTKKVANNDLRPKQIQSNATSGVMQIVGPAAAATRVMTVPDSNFTAARTDAGQTFTGVQEFYGNGGLVNLRWEADGGEVKIDFRKNDGTLLWDIGGGNTIQQDELSFRHNGTVPVLYLDKLFNVHAKNGNFVVGTAAKGVTTGGSFALGLGTNGSTTQATLSTDGNLNIATTGKGVTGDGGAFLQAYSLVTAAGYVDLSINANGFAGILSVSATRGNYNPQSTRTVFAATCYGTTLTTTSLHTQNGSGGSNSFSVTCPSAGVVRITDTSGYGSPTAIYVTFHGAFNYLYA